jgi:lipopolysaccharide/colanic/teichoic acid biosynthesis glycosyltransferase
MRHVRLPVSNAAHKNEPNSSKEPVILSKNKEDDRLAPRVYGRFVKRVFDIALSLVALPFIGLEFLIVAPLITREDKGTFFYNAPRIGQGGKPFVMYKYRTMYMNAPDIVDEDGSTYNAPDDPRLTRIGALLRRTSLDELPQVINILKGDMSFIGPRPDIPREVEQYRGEEPLKLRVKPGISGYAQVYGRNALPWRERLALDVVYVRKQSFWLDVRIFFKTFAVVLGQEGIYEDGGNNGGSDVGRHDGGSGVGDDSGASSIGNSGASGDGNSKTGANTESDPK